MMYYNIKDYLLILFFLFISNFIIGQPGLKHGNWCYIQVVVPAEYKTVEKQVLTNHGQGTVSEQVRVKKESTKFIPVLCDEDLSEDRLKRIRKALRKKGYATNNTETLTPDELIPAMKLFQKDNDLSVIVFFSLETLEKLGLMTCLFPIQKGKVICLEKNLIVDKYKTVKDTIRSSYGKETVITKRELIEKGGYTKYKPCLCEKDLTNEWFNKIKKRLSEKGYETKEIDGSNFKKLMSALVRFQKDKRLPVGHLNLESLEALGIKYFKE